MYINCSGEAKLPIHFNCQVALYATFFFPWTLYSDFCRINVIDKQAKCCQIDGLGLKASTNSLCSD